MGSAGFGWGAGFFLTGKVFGRGGGVGGRMACAAIGGLAADGGDTLSAGTGCTACSFSVSAPDLGGPEDPGGPEGPGGPGGPTGPGTGVNAPVTAAVAGSPGGPCWPQLLTTASRTWLSIRTLTMQRAG